MVFRPYLELRVVVQEKLEAAELVFLGKQAGIKIKRTSEEEETRTGKGKYTPLHSS